MSLKQRCMQFLHDTQIAAPHQMTVDDFVDFVQSEIGRAADSVLEDTKPLVLYFATESDREELVNAIRNAGAYFPAREVYKVRAYLF